MDKQADLGPPFGCPSHDKDATEKGRCFGILTGGGGSFGHQATPSHSVGDSLFPYRRISELNVF